MRLIVQFERLENIKYISQLDMLRTIHRALRRADIPVAYSEGFNPQPRVSFGFALSVGLVSKGEYMDIHLKEDISENEFLNRMNAVMPDGMRLPSAARTNENVPKIGKMIDCAEYEGIFNGDDAVELLNVVNNFFARDAIEMERHSKKGTSYVDIKPWVYAYSVEKADSCSVKMRTIQALSEEMSIKIGDVADAVCKFANERIKGYSTIKINTLLRHNGAFITPVEYTRLITSGKF